METILIVDDEADIRALARDILEGRGYTVLEAGDGADALLIAGLYPEPIHLVLTDVIMPTLSGPDMAEDLKAVRPDTKVVFMSGYTTEVMGQYGAKCWTTARRLRSGPRSCRSPGRRWRPRKLRPPEVHEAGPGARQYRRQLGERGVRAGSHGRRRVESGAVLLGPVVHDDPGLLEARGLLGRVHRVVEVADPVHQVQRLGLLGRVDPAVGQGTNAVLGNPPRLDDQLHEAAVHVVDHPLKDGSLVRRERAEEGARVFHVSRLDRQRSDADFFHEPLRVDSQHDDADAAGDGGGVDEDRVGGQRDVVPARGADIHDRRDHGDLAPRLEVVDLPVEDVGRGDRPARAVDAHDHGLDPVVLLRLP